jgi:hypothetical protein
MTLVAQYNDWLAGALFHLGSCYCSALAVGTFPADHALCVPTRGYLPGGTAVAMLRALLENRGLVAGKRGGV